MKLVCLFLLQKHSLITEEWFCSEGFRFHVTVCYDQESYNHLGCKRSLSPTVKSLELWLFFPKMSVKEISSYHVI